MSALLRFPTPNATPTVSDVPKIRGEDKLFALRLGGVLRTLRAASGLTQEQAAERLNVPTGKLGRWERGDFPPKGYDLGRLFRLYEPFGAEADWFFEPPEIVIVNPVGERLAAKATQPDQSRDDAGVAAAVDTRLPELAAEVRARGRIRSVPPTGRSAPTPKRSSARAKQAT